MSAFSFSMFVRWVTMLVSAALITGCASDRYFMVEKKDLSQLNQLNQISESVSAQNRTIVSLDQEIGKQLDSMAQSNESATKSILTAIYKQSQSYNCPTVPQQTECKATTSESKGTSSTGRTDRFKGKLVVGELEKFYLVGPGIVHDARIDSGAETSSLDSRNITRFERDGNSWVRFDVPLPESEKFVTLEREISRNVKIIQASADDMERRAVVELQFMIGDHHQQAEFTLTNREHLTHEVLVGRNILQDVMLIDVGKEYATELPSPLPDQDNGESQ